MLKPRGITVAIAEKIIKIHMKQLKGEVCTYCISWKERGEENEEEIFEDIMPENSLILIKVIKLEFQTMRRTTSHINTNKNIPRHNGKTA